MQQRFAQERDPYWGVTGFRFNNAIFLKDDYFPSLKYGQNDPNLGNWLTSTFAYTAPATVANNFPTTNVTLTVGEVWGCSTPTTCSSACPTRRSSDSASRDSSGRRITPASLAKSRPRATSRSLRRGLAASAMGSQADRHFVIKETLRCQII